MSIFENAISNLNEFTMDMNISEDILNVLRRPYKVVTVNFPVKMDNGNVKVFTGYRVLYNNSRGPGKGGIRFHQDVSEDEVKSLSFWMSIKNSVLDLPYGGGKGGVICNPKEMSESEIERLSRSYIRAIHRDIGSDTDIPAPDVNTNSQVMKWMVDEYQNITGTKDFAVMTGKPIDFGGSQGRTEATGFGGFYVLEEAVEQYELGGKKIAIQGFGNVGMYFALAAQEAGYTIVSVSDSRGGIYNDDGLDIEKVIDFKKSNGMVSGFPGTRDVTNEEIITLNVDILVPAALENQITKDNASDIRAKVILELANGPTTPEADSILEKKDILLIPDVLANAGGVTVSYFEWLQNKKDEKWEKDKVLSKLKDEMRRAFNDVSKRSNTKNLRIGAYKLAVERIVDSIKKDL